MGRGVVSEACKPCNKRRKTIDVGSRNDKILGSKGTSCTASQAQVASLNVVDLSPERFWREHISQRKPLLIHGHLQDSQFRASRWTNEYLRSRAGDAAVVVEHREDSKGRYGEGRKTRMLFRDFLQRLGVGDDTLYLTTQEAEIGPEGRPELFAPPVAQLTSDFPQQPSLLGNLVPHQINLWMGAAPSGASSGLHHDFHDNLYVLLRGRKRFTLFPPALARRMYTNGRITHIHPNGCIVYEGREEILADGSDAAEVERWQQRRKAEAELAAAEAASERGDAGADARLALAEQALDGLLEAALDDGAAEDYCDSDDEDSLSDSDSHSAAREPRGAKGEESRCKDEAEPYSFSRLDLSTAPKELAAHFPDFPGISAALQVDVHAGDMLYLPAGWFHEVTSFGSEHMALNYWTHPPDNLDPRSEGFSKPYKSEYWPCLWAQRYF